MLSRAKELKARWMEMSIEFFKPLMFENFEVGDKFIGLPEPGDNCGHGGFKGAYDIFMKTETLRLAHRIYVNAVKLRDGKSVVYPDLLYVVKVE